VESKRRRHHRSATMDPEFDYPHFLRSKKDADSVLRSRHFSAPLNTVHRFDKENYFSL
jgi:hypothetical protein